MIYLLFFLSFFVSLAAGSIDEPKTLSLKEIASLPKTVNLAWNKEQSSFHFETKEGEVLFEIFFPGNLPDAFTESEKALFKKTDDGYFFSFHYPSGKRNEANCNHSKWVHSLTLAKPLIVQHQIPFITNDLYLLKKQIKNKRVLFYTGAGISKDADISTMAELDSLLGFEKKHDFVQWAKESLHYPAPLSCKIKTFHESCFTAAPTPAHMALSELALLKRTRIFTENLDLLHQKTGFDVVTVTGALKGLQFLQNIDLVITMGLSRDNKGFLGLYKQLNPRGKIIAIDLQQPNYLGYSDTWFAGDLQEVLPQLLTLMKKN